MLFSHICNETNHKFEPRYSEKPNTIIRNLTSSVKDLCCTPAYAIREIRKLTIIQKYECDVCVYCGKIATKE